MTERSLEIGINFESEADARAFADEVRARGGSADISAEPGILPIAVLLWVVIPPGVGLLAFVANKIAHSWIDHGTLIDARGTGRPQVAVQKGLPYGTIVILSRDGDKTDRSDLPDDASVSDYIGKALKALSEGASATQADQQATQGNGAGDAKRGSAC